MAIRIKDLREGVDAGRGVTLLGLSDEHGKIIAIRFTHEIEGSEEICTKIIPVGRKRGFRKWKLEIVSGGAVTLHPSIYCRDHFIHGWLRNGEWITTLDDFLSIDRGIRDDYMKEAEILIREYDNNATMALAAILISRNMSRLEMKKMKKDE